MANEACQPKLNIPSDAGEEVLSSNESILSSPVPSQVQMGKEGDHTNEVPDLPTLSSTPMSIEISTPCRNNVPFAGRILQVESKYDIKQKLQERDVMPTWGARYGKVR